MNKKNEEIINKKINIPPLFQEETNNEKIEKKENPIQRKKCNQQVQQGGQIIGKKRHIGAAEHLAEGVREAGCS